MAVAPGPHHVEVRARGYDPFHSQVNLGDGETRRMMAHLRRSARTPSWRSLSAAMMRGCVFARRALAISCSPPALSP
jgi:hypothetical protein